MTTTNIAIERHNRYAATILAIVMLIVIVWFAAEMAYAQDEPRKPAPPTPATTAPASAPASAAAHRRSTDKSADADANASAPAPAPYTPTPDQQKDLRIAQLEAINAQQAMSNAQSAFQSAVNGLAAVCRKVVADNKWPADVQCNPDMNPVAFTRSAAAATAATGTPAKK